MARRSRYRHAAANPARGSCRVALATRYRPVQFAGRSTQDCLASARWPLGHPLGRLATTHILWLPTGHFEGHAENEPHPASGSPADLGLPTAQSTVNRFGDEIAIVVERYDRLQRGNGIIRIHQEDMCQARGIMPTKKYQNEGGPGRAGHPRAPCGPMPSAAWMPRFPDPYVGAFGFNWLIGGTDAHAKNYSLLLGTGSVRLAPLYDVASILPYDDVDFRKLKLAMKIGGEYKLAQIGLPEWAKLARESRLDRDALIARLISMATALPDHMNDAPARSGRGPRRGIRRSPGQGAHREGSSMPPLTGQGVIDARLNAGSRSREREDRRGFSKARPSGAMTSTKIHRTRNPRSWAHKRASEGNGTSNRFLAAYRILIASFGRPHHSIVG